MGHLNSLLHTPLAINLFLFFLIHISFSFAFYTPFFISLFVPPSGGTAQSDKATDGHFSSHFSLSFLSDKNCDCMTSWSLIDRGRGGVCVFRRGWEWGAYTGVKMMVCVCLDALWGDDGDDDVCVCACMCEGVLRQGGALVVWESWGEEVWGSREERWGRWGWRQSSTHSPSLTLWQFGGFTLSCLALFVCALRSVSHVKVRPHCPLVPIWPLGITAVRTRAKADNDSWAWLCRHRTFSAPEELPLVI